MKVVPGGPAAYLPEGSVWLDRIVVFDIPRQSALTSACQQMWEISGQLRAARGRSGKSASDVAALAYVRRQTVTAIEMGTVWPDARTLELVCFVLDVRLEVAHAK